jgi:WD40 repeat protein
MRANLAAAAVTLMLTPSAGHPGAAARQQSSAVTPVLTLQTGHSDSITAVTFSPDGQLMATGSVDGTARLWHVETGSSLRVFEGAHTNAVVNVAFSPASDRLATAGQDGTVTVWRTLAGTPELLLQGHERGVLAVTFSADGRLLLTGGQDGTARLWDINTKRELRRFGGEGASASAVGFSPDNRVALAVMLDSTIRRWDVTTGADLGSVRLAMRSGTMESAAFSADRHWLFTTSSLTGPRVWRLADGWLQREFQVPDVSFRHTAYSSDGTRVVATSTDGAAYVWNLQTGQMRRFVAADTPAEMAAPFSRSLTATAFSADGERVAVALAPHQSARGREFAANSARVRLWDTMSGQHLADIGGVALSVDSLAVSHRQIFMANGVHGIAFWDANANQLSRPFAVSRVLTLAASADGRRLLTLEPNGIAKVWNPVTAGHVQLEHSLSKGETVASFSHDGRLLVTSHQTQPWPFSSASAVVRLWNAETGSLLKRIDGHTEGRLSSDGNRLLSMVQAELTQPSGFRTLQRRSYVWDTATGRELRSFLVPEADGAALARGGGVWVSSRRSLTLFDVDSGRELQSLNIDSWPLTWSDDARYVLAQHLLQDAFSLWDLERGNLLHRFEETTGVRFFPDGQRLLTAHRDGTARIWKLRDGAVEEQAQLASFEDGSWAIVDREGRFDLSRERAVTGLHWAAALEPIALDQLKDRYFQPNLLSSVLGISEEPLRDVRSFNERGIELYPDLSLNAPTATSAELGIELRNRGGGIGRVQVFVNDKELAADARGTAVDPNADAATLRVNLAEHPFLVPGEDNVIEVRAHNRDEYLSSRGLKIVYRPPARTTEPPTLWAVIAGVSDYQGSILDLRFAAKDAEDFARALELGATRLFGVERTRIRVLSTSPGRERPTKTNLSEALRELTRSSATDIVVVYLAGHGITHGGAEGDFYFLTGEAASAALGDPALRSQTAISSTEIARFIGQSNANKQVLILDTCHAGRAVEKLSDTRQIPASQIRALDRLRERFGMFVLAGSAADAVSYETSRYGQGLLTYSLLMGMRGAALRDDSYVDVGPLMNFAADKVEELARGIGGIQRPVLALPRGGSSFDLGRLTPEDKTRVPLALERPLVLRASFQDDRRVIDHLNLTRHVNEQLRQLASQTDAAPVMFVDASEFPDAYVITGRYQVEASDVTAQILVFRDAKSMGEVRVTGRTDALDKLADSIVSSALGLIK